MCCNMWSGFRSSGYLIGLLIIREYLRDLYQGVPSVPEPHDVKEDWCIPQIPAHCARNMICEGARCNRLGDSLSKLLRAARDGQACVSQAGSVWYYEKNTYKVLNGGGFMGGRYLGNLREP